MGADDFKFQIKDPYIFSQEESALIEVFKALPPEEMHGFWNAAKDAPWVKLKKNLKDHYIKTQDYRCPYCLQRIEVGHNGAWDAEHIIPRVSHPQFTFEAQNLCISCKDCNGAKGEKPVTYARVKQTFSTISDDYLVCHPHFDEYSDHIRIISIAGFYLPRTEKGKSLIEICGLLRFLFKYSGHDCDLPEVQKKSAELNAMLQETNDPLVLHYIFDCLAELAAEGKRLMRERVKANAMAERAS